MPDSTDSCNNHNDFIDIDSDGIPMVVMKLLIQMAMAELTSSDLPGYDDSIDVDRLITDGCDNLIDDEIEVKNEQSSNMSGEIRALAIISVLVLTSLILIVIIRRGKPPTNEENHSFSGKQYPKF